MAEYKNQHFVPKAHFKPFSIDGEGSAINLYLISAGRAVPGASIKGQCARHYIYGQDGKLEKLLNQIEGRYGQLVRNLQNEAYRLDEEDKWLLRYFLLLQSHRTAEQMERGMERITDMAAFFRAAEEAHGNAWDPRHDPTREKVMMELMLSFNEQMQEGVLDDLKTVIVRNRTDRDFITSDDPAVTTNRWLLQRKSIKIFGTNAAGLIMFMPLGPRTLALNYDPAVYSVPCSPALFVNLDKLADVHAFNEHQFMRAASAIYFHRSDDADLLAREFAAAKHLRPEAWDSFRVAQRDGGTATHSRFVIGESSEVAKADEILFHLAREWPSPSRWPSILKFRQTAHGFTRGRPIIRRARMADKMGESAAFRRVR